MKIDPKIIVQSAEIPPVPAILQQIMSLADNPNTTSSKLEKIVSQEPALVTRLLKWVNSALYSLPYKISSISHAMVLLGFSTVKSVASGMILVDTFASLPSIPQETVLSLWQHGLYEANAVKILSTQEPAKKQDDLYLAGLLHDVGHLVLGQYFHNDYTGLFTKDHFPTCEEELPLFETDHATIGALLLEEWKFATPVVDLVKEHHQEVSADKPYAAYLKLAEILSHQTDLEVFFNQPPDDILNHTLSCTRLTLEKLVGFKDSLMESRRVVDQLFEGGLNKKAPQKK